MLKCKSKVAVDNRFFKSILLHTFKPISMRVLYSKPVRPSNRSAGTKSDCHTRNIVSIRKLLHKNSIMSNRILFICCRTKAKVIKSVSLSVLR